MEEGYWEDDIWVYCCEDCGEYLKGEAVLDHTCPNWSPPEKLYVPYRTRL